MFEKRLTWFWILLTVLAIAIVGRLAHIQVVQAREYEELADRILTRPVRYLPAPRGTVYDRNKTPLLSDEPTSNICIHYAILVGRDDYLLSVARGLRRRGDYPDDMSLRAIADELRLEITSMWQRLAVLTGLTITELNEQAKTVRASVERIKAAVRRSNPTIRRIVEEDQLLPVLEDVDSDVALAVRLELERLPWIRVTPSSRRVAHDADALVHVLGRLGQASAERIADDPLKDDELRRLRPGDHCGISGVERMGETSLRGWAGRIVEDFDHSILERTNPVPGYDVHLTIDTELQRYILDLLEKAIDGDPSQDPPVPGVPKNSRAGAAAVVIDVASREILALVSYPIYSYHYYNVDYDRLRRDTKLLPLSFRAVQAQYPPGSTCKVISLIGALSEGVVTPETRFHCTGHLLPGKPDRFRCWIFNQYPGLTHDMVDDPAGQDGESAVRNSCNIYFYNVGGLLGPQRLCEWFTRFGLGHTQGTALIEESPGIVPTEAWLLEHQGRRHRRSDAWNFAIGQGEVTATPLQAANVAASVAAGYWVPVRLAYDSTGKALGADPTPSKPFNEHYLEVLRRGMWRVANERGGTAPRARMESKDYELCGKTGSAQAMPRVVNRRYLCEWPDGRRESVIAISKEDALAQFGDEKPEIVGWRAHERYPPLGEDEKLPSHAWFIGYTQRATKKPTGRPPTGERVYAISVIVEYGGSGGRVAAPIARKIAEKLVNEE